MLGAEKCRYGNDGPCGHQGAGEDYGCGPIKGRVEA